MERVTLGLWLRGAYLSFHRRAQAELAPHGVTADQFVVLSLLADEGELTQGDIVHRSFSDSSTVGAVVGLLEVRGLVSRRRDERDGRVRRVRLTAKGRGLQQKLAQIVAPLREQLTDALTPQEQQALRRALAKITHAMSARPSPEYDMEHANA